MDTILKVHFPRRYAPGIAPLTLRAALRLLLAMSLKVLRSMFKVLCKKKLKNIPMCYAQGTIRLTLQSSFHSISASLIGLPPGIRRGSLPGERQPERRLAMTWKSIVTQFLEPAITPYPSFEEVKLLKIF